MLHAYTRALEAGNRQFDTTQQCNGGVVEIIALTVYHFLFYFADEQCDASKLVRQSHDSHHPSTIQQQMDVVVLTFKAFYSMVVVCRLHPWVFWIEVMAINARQQLSHWALLQQQQQI